MKYSKKGDSPAWFEQWKQDEAESVNGFRSLRKPEKPRLLHVLLDEQGRVCCYCGSRIGMGLVDCHIDHFLPQSEYPELSLDYANLFVSCGPGLPHRGFRRCGDAKGSKQLSDASLSPSKEECERRFRYRLSGSVEASVPSDLSAADAIETLNLNETSLRVERSRIIEDLEREAPALDADEIDAFICQLSVADAQGREPAFVQVTRRYLEDEFRG